MLFNFVHFSPQLVGGTEYQVRWSNSDAEQTVEVLIYSPGGERPQRAIRLTSRPHRNGRGWVTDRPPSDVVLEFPCPDPPVRTVVIDARRAVIRLQDDSRVELERAA